MKSPIEKSNPVSAVTCPRCKSVATVNSKGQFLMHTTQDGKVVCPNFTKGARP